MSEETSTGDEILIKIPRSVWDKSASQQAGSVSDAYDYSEIFVRTGVRVISGKRNSNHGLTQIQTLAIPVKEQKDKILQLLDNPALYSHLPKLFDCLYEMGRANDGEVRFFAAMAVVELARFFPFTDLNNAVIAPWAKDTLDSVNKLAALTLVNLIQKNIYRSDVLNLLRNWIHIYNVNFVNTALTTYFSIAKEYPDEVLEGIKIILLGNHATLLIPQALTLLEWLYLHEPIRVVNTMYDWSTSSSSGDLLLFTALTFLSVVEINDLVTDASARARAVEMTYRLWEDLRMPQHLHLEQLTTDAVLSWAEMVLCLDANDSKKQLGIQFFHELYNKCATAKRNRLDFHLKRWQKLETMKQQRANKWQKVTDSYNFISLIPEK